MSQRSDLESFLVGITESQDGVIERINAPEQSTHRSTSLKCFCVFASEHDCNNVLAKWGTLDSACF